MSPTALFVCSALGIIPLAGWIGRATDEARRLNVERLYLWTHSAEGLYYKLGWQVVERTNYFGKDAVVMQIDPGGT